MQIGFRYLAISFIGLIVSHAAVAQTATKTPLGTVVVTKVYNDAYQTVLQIYDPSNNTVCYALGFGGVNATPGGGASIHCMPVSFTTTDSKK